MDRKRTHCPCSSCSSYIATKNCHSCSKPLCISCTKVAVVKFSDNLGSRVNSDFELLERCGNCYVDDKLPVIINGRSVECNIQ